MPYLNPKPYNDQTLIRLRQDKNKTKKSKQKNYKAIEKKQQIKTTNKQNKNTTDGESDCCLTPNERFVSYIMARTRHIVMLISALY